MISKLNCIYTIVTDFFTTISVENAEDLEHFIMKIDKESYSTLEVYLSKDECKDLIKALSRIIEN